MRGGDKRGIDSDFPKGLVDRLPGPVLEVKILESCQAAKETSDRNRSVLGKTPDGGTARSVPCERFYFLGGGSCQQFVGMFSVYWKVMDTTLY